MSIRRRKNSDVTESNQWINTYSTCITVILTFFILLFCITSKEQKKLTSVSNTTRGTFSDNDSISTKQNNVSSVIGQENQADPSQQQNIYEIVKDYVNNNSMKSDVEVQDDDMGVIIQIKDSLLFQSGKADLIPEAKTLLEKIAKLMSEMKNNIKIEGHTDNVPINTFKFESNWELSTSRAVNVLRYFIEDKKLDPKRFGAEGYGEYRPLVNNDTPENRAKNRRINIVILTSNKGE